MIEQAMIFALGFLIAGLIALAIAPAFWSRAIRLSRRRIEMQIPLSAREILAERDLLRAESAVEQRRLEQKIESLNQARAGDLNELGRRATIIASQQAKLAGLGRQFAERGAELAATQRALAESTAKFAATETALYSATGLFERKDSELRDVKADLAAARSEAQAQRAAIAACESEIAKQRKLLAASSAEIARIAQELESKRLEHDADIATLKATTVRLADRDEALNAAEKRESDLHRRIKQQIETTRAVERRHLEKIDRLRAAEAEAREALAALRHPASVSLEQEENAVLRQEIQKIGAAVIHMTTREAASSPDAAAGEDLGQPAANQPGRALVEAGGGASSK